MALQGTLETFSIPDVLQLLSSTSKTGRLAINGDRGDGSVWLEGGAIIGASASGAPHATSPIEVVFELLRFGEGEFVFEDGVAPEESGGSAELGPVLAEAGEMLTEWKELEAIVPSGAAWLTLAPSLSGDEVTVSADDWLALVALAGGSSVDALGAKLELGEVGIARRIKALTEQGLVEVGDPREGAASEARPEPAAEPEPESAAEPEPESAAEPEPESAAESEPEPEAEPAAATLEAVPDVAEATLEPEPEPEPAAAPTPAPVPAPGEAAEIARQLANLSPKAARAVAAAAKATTEEERDQYLAEVEAADDQINRDLLLKFLGTVN